MKQAISWSPAPKLKTPFQIFIPQEAADLLEKEYAKYPRNPWLFSSSRAGAMHRPHSGGHPPSANSERRKQDEAAQAMGNLMVQIQ
ncbi:hypothetical protein [Dysosmobacter sp.]|uniref:hypothetical protein n=1 Tax=Dysosmobacter sp. TaxID=2591382 RepID=UPI003FD82B22